MSVRCEEFLCEKVLHSESEDIYIYTHRHSHFLKKNIYIYSIYIHKTDRYQNTCLIIVGFVYVDRYWSKHACSRQPQCKLLFEPVHLF